MKVASLLLFASYLSVKSSLNFSKAECVSTMISNASIINGIAKQKFSEEMPLSDHLVLHVPTFLGLSSHLLQILATCSSSRSHFWDVLKYMRIALYFSFCYQTLVFLRSRQTINLNYANYSE